MRCARVGRARFVALEDADELVPLAGLGVEDLEVVPAPERDVLLLQRSCAWRSFGCEREQRAVRVDRALVVVQAIAGDLPELVQELDLGGGVVGELGLLPETSASLS